MRALLYALPVLALPTLASAEILSTAVGVFNIIVGLLLVLAFLLYFGGMAMWALRLGVYPSYRDEAIRILEWAVAVMFVLIVLLAIVQFVQKHLAAASFVVGVAVVLAVVWLILTVATKKPADEDGH